MKFAPFVTLGHNQLTISMGLHLHLVPHSHLLYFGPIECARHSFPLLADDPCASMLVVSDVQSATGLTEDLVEQAVAEIMEMRKDIDSIVLCTACQTAFIGIDFRALLARLHARFDIGFVHVEANRMLAENIPGATRKSVVGGDRFHVRRSWISALEQAPISAKDNRAGLLVLSDDKFDSSNELIELAPLYGFEWVRTVGDCTNFSDFAALAGARLAIMSSMVWSEAADWLEAELHVPVLRATTSYSLHEIDAYYDKLDEMCQKWADLDSVCQRRHEAQRMARRFFFEARRVFTNEPIELDARAVKRPFSLAETLESYGFNIVDIMPAPLAVKHREDDDAPAFERLCAKHPGMRERFEAPFKSDASSCGRTYKTTRSGRFIERKIPSDFEWVPEETAWWGYASLIALMEQMLGPKRVRMFEKKLAKPKASPEHHSTVIKAPSVVCNKVMDMTKARTNEDAQKSAAAFSQELQAPTFDVDSAKFRLDLSRLDDADFE